MKNTHRFLILVLIAAALGGTGFWLVRSGRIPLPGAASSEKAVYYCPMHPAYTSDRPGDCPICNMKLVRRSEAKEKKNKKILYYRHPMGQPDVSPVPKKDSMGMDYVPVYEDEAGEAPKAFTIEELLRMKPGEVCLLHKCKKGKCLMAMTQEIARLGKCPACGEDLGVIVKDLVPKGYSGVRLSSEKQQLIGIKTSPVKKITMTKTIRTSGRIAYDPGLYQAEEEYLEEDVKIQVNEGKEEGAKKDGLPCPHNLSYGRLKEPPKKNLLCEGAKEGGKEEHGGNNSRRGFFHEMGYYFLVLWGSVQGPSGVFH